jgi:hypothetical protein
MSQAAMLLSANVSIARFFFLRTVRRKFMPRYEVSLTSSFLITTQAESEETAQSLAEFYVVHTDGSTIKERAERNFLIEQIEMTVNEASEVNQLSEG